MKEETMMYKSLTLEMISLYPILREQLRISRQLLRAVDQWALELKQHHQAIEQSLLFSRPTSTREQICSEALEIALAQLQESLASLTDETHALDQMTA
jgi:hypothetical protein